MQSKYSRKRISFIQEPAATFCKTKSCMHNKCMGLYGNLALVRARAKGETCCVQVYVNVEQAINLAETGYAWYEVKNIEFFCY